MNVASALLPLMSLPGVEQATNDARADVDALLWDRTLLRVADQVAVEAAARSVRATAALEGADVSLASIRSSAAFDNSPMGRVVAAANVMRTELPHLVAVAASAPLQAWARLAAIAGAGFVAADDLGRPRRTDEVQDPLHLGGVVSAGDLPARLDQLSRVALATDVPAVLASAIVHGELLTLRPFAFGNGLVARAAARLVLAVRGIDKDLLTVPESGLVSLGRPAYVDGARRFMAGTPEGLAHSIVMWCSALHEGAVETAAVAAELGA